MKSTNKIRPVALLLARKDSKYLVFEGEDKTKKNIFFRSLGGGIEFGEDSKTALKREIKEEINAGIKNLKLLKILENIFDYNGIHMHEIIFIYSGEFENRELYNKKEIEILDSDSQDKAIWVEKKELLKTNFYPEGVKDLIK